MVTTHRTACRIVAQGFSPATVGADRYARDDARQDAALKGGATQADAVVDLGPNNERLEDAKPELVNALRELVRQYRQEGIVARRNEIRRIRQARLFWQGLQYAWWNPADMNWHMPYENRSNDDRELEDMPRYQFVTNFYQGFGLSFIAVLSQDVPSVQFYPQSAQSLQDIGAARAASDVADLIERNNEVEQLLTTIGYFLWTDGKLGAYVRYVADGQRFGFHEEQSLPGQANRRPERSNGRKNQDRRPHQGARRSRNRRQRGKCPAPNRPSRKVVRPRRRRRCRSRQSHPLKFGGRTELS